MRKTPTNSENPANRFGGTWEQIVDKFLYCANSSGQTGGSNKISVDNLPAHSHTFTGDTQTGEIPAVMRMYGAANVSGCVKQSSNWTHSVLRDGGDDCFGTTIMLEIPNTGTIGETGSGTDYMPPYMTVYAWKRTA